MFGSHSVFSYSFLIFCSPWRLNDLEAIEQVIVPHRDRDHRSASPSSLFSHEGRQRPSVNRPRNDTLHAAPTRQTTGLSSLMKKTNLPLCITGTFFHSKVQCVYGVDGRVIQFYKRRFIIVSLSTWHFTSRMITITRPASSSGCVRSPS